MKAIYAGATIFLALYLALTSLNAQTKMTVSKNRLALGDTLTISFKAVPHEEEMSIETPSMKYFWVSTYRDSDNPTNPMFDPDKFRLMPTIEIITDRTEAIPCAWAVTKAEKIFSESGKYIIRFGEITPNDGNIKIRRVSVFYNAGYKKRQRK